MLKNKIKLILSFVLPVLLIFTYALPLTAQTEEGNSLHDIVLQADLAEIEEAIAETNDINEHNFDNNTPLMIAAINSNDPAIIEVLIEGGADPNLDDDFTGRAPLHLAALENNNLAITKALVDGGADVNQKSQSDIIPLNYAVQYNSNPEIVQYLLDSGADINNVNIAGEFPIMQAIHNRQDVEPEILISMLLEAGADPNIGLKNDLHPLSSAINQRLDIEIIEKLIEAGSEVNFEDQFGETPLVSSANYRDLELMELLLDSGADPNMKNYQGYTALTAATSFDTSIEVVEMLLEAGVDVNATANNGETALMQAALFSDDPEIIKKLLEYGADPTIEDDEGRDALVYLGDNFRLKDDETLESILSGDLTVDEYAAAQAEEEERLAQVFADMDEADKQEIVDNFIADFEETIYEGSDALEKHLAPLIDFMGWDTETRSEFLSNTQEAYHDDDFTLEIHKKDYYTSGSNLVIRATMVEEYLGERYEDDIDFYFDLIDDNWYLYSLQEPN